MHPSKRRLAAVETALTNRGVSLSKEDGRLVGTGGTVPGLDEGTSVAVMSPRDGTPLTIGSYVATAASDGHVPLLVTSPETADEIRAVLSAPFLLADADEASRTFYAIADRIQLPDGAYACIAADGPIEWVEQYPDNGDTTLRCTVGDRTVVVLDGVEALRCPDGAPFPYRYRRNDAKRFEVLDDGGVIGRFGSVREMQAAGYRPLSVPFVPEHHVRTNEALARDVLLAVVDGEHVELSSVDTGSR